MTQAHFAAILAFAFWGTLPIYWKMFSQLGAWDIFAYRLIFSVITLFVIMLYKKKLGRVFLIWKNKKMRYMLMMSAVLISSNWLIYIYAVNTGRVIEASMGYFLNPLLNVFMGRIFLKENLRKTQWPSIILAILAIIFIALQTDLTHFPWVGLLLAFTFAFYGLIRKVTEIGSLEGLTFEITFILFPVLIYWTILPTSPMLIFESISPWKFFLLSLSGVLTCVPLILFAYGAKRLRFQTMGFIQYLSPILKFMCGLLVFHEPLSQNRLYTFILIWLALAWYSTESVFFMKKTKKMNLPIPE